MKKLILLLILFNSSLLFGTISTMEFNGTSTTEAGVGFTYSLGAFVNSSDGSEMDTYDNHPYAHPLNGGGDYKDIIISKDIYITSVNVTWAVNVQDFKLQFLFGESVVKELSSLTTGDITVNILADKIRFYDDGASSSGGFELATVSWDDTMPVELVSFSASIIGSIVKLVWTTATELNNYGFEILRSNQNDFSIYNTIGFIKGHGNSSSPKFYSFLEESGLDGTINYRLKQIDNDGKFEYSDIITIQAGMSYGYKLEQNYPNPFNPSTLIKYSIQEGSHVEIKLFDMIGNEIQTLIDEFQSAGMHELEFNSDLVQGTLPSGVYFYRINTGNFTQIKKMILIR